MKNLRKDSLAVVAVLFLIACGDSDGHSQAFKSNTIVDVAEGAGVIPRLTSAFESAGWDEALRGIVVYPLRPVSILVMHIDSSYLEQNLLHMDDEIISKHLLTCRS